MDFDTAVKLNIYDSIAREARIPTAMDVSGTMNVPTEDVLAAFQRLHQKRLLVPEPGDPARIRMAPPFSGIQTPFPVYVSDKFYYANCVWDAFGIPAALHADGVVHAADGFTGEPITLVVQDGLPSRQNCAIHFAVPAARWWQDIIYT